MSAIVSERLCEVEHDGRVWGGYRIVETDDGCVHVADLFIGEGAPENLFLSVCREILALPGVKRAVVEVGPNYERLCRCYASLGFVPISTTMEKR